MQHSAALCHIPGAACSWRHRQRELPADLRHSIATARRTPRCADERFTRHDAEARGSLRIRSQFTLRRPPDSVPAPHWWQP